MRQLIQKRANLALLGIAFATTLMACGSADDAAATSDESELKAANVLVLGNVNSGDRKTFTHRGTPRYSAYSFTAKKGDHVSFGASTRHGDTVAYILGPSFSLLARNDDAVDETMNSFVEKTIARDGTYYVAVKELGGQPISVTVSLEVQPP